MHRHAVRVLTFALVLPLSGWFVASAMAPVPTQDPKPKPESGGEQREGERSGPRGEGRRGGGAGPSLHRSMELIGTESERVTGSIADPAQNEVTLQGLGRIIGALGASQSGEPKNMSTIAADAQAAHKLAFRRALTVLVRDVAEVELLVIDGKNAEAEAMFKAKVLAMSDPNHEKFGGEDE